MIFRSCCDSFPGLLMRHFGHSETQNFQTSQTKLDLQIYLPENPIWNFAPQTEMYSKISEASLYACKT